MRREEPLDQVVGRVVVMTIEQKPNERIAVGVRTVARHAEQYVARSEIIRARPQRITVYGSNDCPGDIDRTFGVHARHLGGLATEQREPTSLHASAIPVTISATISGTSLAVAM